MRGVCHQHHFPAVARPFRILWAPWAPAVFCFFAGMMLSVVVSLVFGTTYGSILMPIGIVVGHGIAIAIGTKAQYMATLVTGMENRRTGSTNLTEDGGNFDFANL